MATNTYIKDAEPGCDHREEIAGNDHLGVERTRVSRGSAGRTAEDSSAMKDQDRTPPNVLKTHPIRFGKSFRGPYFDLRGAGNGDDATPATRSPAPLGQNDTRATI